MADFLDEYYGAPEEKPRAARKATRVAPSEPDFLDDYYGAAAPAAEAESSSGFISDAKRAGGQALRGIGSSLRDLGAEGAGGAIQRYGEGVVANNPADINSTAEFLANPMTGIREGVGEALPQLGIAAGASLVGGAIGGALGSAVAPGPGTVAGAAIGSTAARYGINLLQSYGGIRAEQREQGIDDKGRALAAGAASAGLDTLFGAEALVGKALRPGADLLKREAGKRLLPHVAKQIGLGVASEGATEAVQSGIERYGAHRDLGSPEALDEYGLSALKGGAGGGVIRGGAASIAGQRAPIGGSPILDDEEEELTPPSVSPTPRQTMQQAQQEMAQVMDQAERDQASDIEGAREYYRIKPSTEQGDPEGTFNVLGAKVYGPQSAEALAAELSQLQVILPEARKAIEQALMDSGTVQLNPTSQPTVKSVARAFDTKIKNLQLQEAESVEQAKKILDSQIAALEKAGKDATDKRLAELTAISKALSKVPEPEVAPTIEAPAVPSAPAQPVLPQGDTNGIPSVPVAGTPGSMGSGSVDVQPSVGPTGPVLDGAAGGGGDRVAGLPGVGAGQPAVPAVPGGAGERTPAVAVVQQSRLGKRRVVKPAGPVQAYVAPPSEDVTGIDNRPPADATDDLSDAAEVAAVTGQEGIAQAMVEEEAGTRSDGAAPLPDDAADRIIAKRLEGGQPRLAARDRQIIKAYLATMQHAPKGAKGKIAQALADTFGVTTKAITKIGNPRLLVEAAEALGYDPDQARELFGITERGTGKEMPRNQEDVTRALAAQGLTGAEGESSGFGGDDADRFWAETGTSAEEKRATYFADLARKIEGMKATMAELDEAGMKEAVAAIAKARDVLEQTAAEEMAKAEAEAKAEAAAKAKKAKPTAKPKAKAEEKDEAPAGAGEIEDDEDLALTSMERAEQNWNKAVKEIGVADLPLFAELPSDFQDEFADYPPKDQKAQDVMQLLRKMEKEGVTFGGDEESDVEYGKDEGDDSPKYSARELTAELKEFMRVDSLGDKVIIVDRPNQLPTKLDVAIGSLETDAFGWTRNGQAVLIASRIAKGEGRAKFMHEVGSHLGIEGLVDDPDLEDLAGQIATWAGKNDGSRESSIAKRVLMRIENAQTPDDQLESELVAYFVEEAMLDGIDPTASNITGALRQWFRKLITNFKAALGKLGFEPEKLTAQDIVDIAYGAARLTIAPRMDVEVKETEVKFGKNIAVPKAARPSVNIMTRHMSARQHAGNVLNKVIFSEDLFNRAAKMGIPSALDMGAHYKSRAATVANLQREVQRVEDLYKAVPANERGHGPTSANDLLKDITMSNAWAFKPDWVPKATVDAALARRFSRLSKASQDWIKATLKHGHDSLTRKKDVVKTAIDGEYDPMIREAVRVGNTAKAAKLMANKNAQIKEFQKLFTVYEGHPYAPLRRFGDYVVVAKSADYVKAENAKDFKALRKLETDAKHYRVDFYESMAEAENTAVALTGRYAGGEVYARAKEAARSDMYGGMMDAFNRLRADLDRRIGDPDSDSDLQGLKRARNMVSELYLQALSESSARKSELKRKGIAGEIDMLRSFTKQGMADAYFIAAAKFNPATLETIQKMRMESRHHGDSMRKSLIFNEIMARYSQSMRPHESEREAVQYMTRATSIWMLGTAPMYYFQNLMQPFMLSVPFMTGRHNWGTAMGELTKAYTQISGVFKGVGATRQVNLTAVPADVKSVIEELANRGRIDIGMETELGKVKLAGDTATERALQGAMDVIDAAVKRVEVVNRITTGMAAYRMEFRRTRDKGAAIDYADKVISQTHGDYSAVNAPRAFNTAWGKVALQFRKFQLIQLTLLAKMVHASLAGESPEVRAVGRRVLRNTLMHTGVMAGVVGMPGFAAVSWLLTTLDSIFGDDDEEPFDLELWLRQQAKGAGAPKWVEDVLLRGAPTQGGADISGRVGMGNALSVVPFTDLEMSRKGATELMVALGAGASGGLGIRIAEGAALIKDGDYYRGLEKLLPRGVSDFLKGARESQSGVTRLNEDVLIKPEEISWLRTTATMAGIPLHSESKRRVATDALYRNREHFEGRASKLREEFIVARREGKSTAKIVEDWRKLQDARAKAGLQKQPVSSLFRSAKAATKRDKQTVGGVQLRKGERGVAERLDLEDQDED